MLNYQFLSLADYRVHRFSKHFITCDALFIQPQTLKSRQNAKIYFVSFFFKILFKPLTLLSHFRSFFSKAPVKKPEDESKAEEQMETKR